MNGRRSVGGRSGRPLSSALSRFLGGGPASAPKYTVAIKGPDRRLLDTAIPKVVITKDAIYWYDGPPDPEAEVDLIAMIRQMLRTALLAGFVVEGFRPARLGGYPGAMYG